MGVLVAVASIAGVVVGSALAIAALVASVVALESYRIRGGTRAFARGLEGAEIRAAPHASWQLTSARGRRGGYGISVTTRPIAPVPIPGRARSQGRPLATLVVIEASPDASPAALGPTPSAAEVARWAPAVRVVREARRAEVVLDPMKSERAAARCWVAVRVAAELLEAARP